MTMPICFRLLMQLVRRACSLALFNAGRSMAARIAMIATTIRSSINVKHLPRFLKNPFLFL